MGNIKTGACCQTHRCKLALDHGEDIIGRGEFGDQFAGSLRIRIGDQGFGTRAADRAAVQYDPVKFLGDFLA